MKRVQLSTWQTCFETKVRLEKGSLAYQNLETKRIYSLCSNTVREWLLSTEDGSLIPNEEPVNEF